MSGQRTGAEAAYGYRELGQNDVSRRRPKSPEPQMWARSGSGNARWPRTNERARIGRILDRESFRRSAAGGEDREQNGSCRSGRLSAGGTRLLLWPSEIWIYELGLLYILTRFAALQHVGRLLFTIPTSFASHCPDGQMEQKQVMTLNEFRETTGGREAKKDEGRTRIAGRISLVSVSPPGSLRTQESMLPKQPMTP